jgi:hypothetical protein
VVTVEEIVFLGQQAELGSKGKITNTLDSESVFILLFGTVLITTSGDTTTTPARRGFWFFKGTGSSGKRAQEHPSLVPPSTPTPAPPLKRQRTDQSSADPLTRTRQGGAAASIIPTAGSSTTGPHDDIYI